MFLPISADFTLTPGIPFTPITLEPRSFECSSTVELWDFTSDFPGPTDPLRPINPNNACHLCITAAAGTELAVASSAGTVKVADYLPATCSPQLTGVYNPKAFILHAASRRQGFPHCERFSTAATRRCLDSVSVPVWLTILSDQLPVLALVSHYLTN